MSQKNHSGSLLPQKPGDEGLEQVGIGYAYNVDLINDLLYGDDRPAAERIERLREIRAELSDDRTRDFGGGDSDSAAMINEIDDALARLESSAREEEDLDGYDNTVAQGFDPADHRELLSPDDDMLMDIEEEDEESTQEDGLDASEWDKGDDFPPDRGVH